MGKAFSFFLFVWIGISFLGGVMQGSTPVASTVLTADINDSVDVIPVVTTGGYLDTGIIVIGDERIAYSAITDTSFRDTLWKPMVRGAQDTDAVAHSLGSGVRTVEGGMMNDAVTYNIAVIADATGLWAAVTIGLAILRLLVSFFTLPIGFLGTDLAIIGVIWWAMVAGMIISFGVALAGGRRLGF